MIRRMADDRKEEVRRATDIVALVQRYLPLRRSGRSFAAGCPFHEDRDPSFHVWPESQRWKCFSCNRSGDAFSFVMEKEQVDFPEALRMLARDAGINLDPPDPAAAAAHREAASAKDAAYEALAFACRWYQSRLKGSEAAAYLKSRGLTGETALEWRLGYAPEGWDGLLQAAAREGIPAAVLETAGLAVPRSQGGQKGEGHYDRFRRRVMFPIADAGGRVVGFGARALGDDQPKYLNSPDSAVFQKGSLLFGLDRAREEAGRTRTLAVMEGYMDVIMAHQHGIRTAVAGLGTAFTPSHASLMRRFADRIVLVYDADAAGRNAADRALGILLGAELDARVAVLPGGEEGGKVKDPCDLLVERGPEPLREALEGAREVFDHLLAETAARHDLASISGRTAAADEMLRTVAAVPNAVRRGLMVGRIGGMFGFSEEEIRARARQIAPAHQHPGHPRPNAVAEGAPARSGPVSGSRRERMLLEAALGVPGLAGRLATEAPAATFASGSLARIAAAVVETAVGGDADPAACAASLGDDVLADEVAALAAAAGEKDPDDLRRQFDDCVASQSHDRRIEEARRRFAEARSHDNQPEEDRWLAELQRLQAERKAPPRPVKR